MIPRRKINLCQPGFGASCSLCCGSHNSRLSLRKMEKMYRKRARIYNTEQNTVKKDHPPLKGVTERLMKICPPRLIHKGIQCAFIGLTDMAESTIIGCLAYRDSDRINTANRLFFANTCKTFYCAGWDLLEDDEVLFAAQLMGDWYFYSLLIADIGLLKDYFRRYRDPGKVTEKEKLMLRGLLEDTIRDLLIR